MSKNYLVTRTVSTRVSITIDKYVMWDNFVNCWADLAKDDYANESAKLLKSVKDVADALLLDQEDWITESKIKGLFNSGYTCLLMGNAMQELENNDILREIIVLNNGNTIVIPHKNINF